MTWRIRLIFIVDIYYCPEWIIASFTLCVNIARAQAHAHRYVVLALDGHAVELAMLVDDLADYLQLVVRVGLDVRLQRLLADDLIRAALYFDLDLKGVSLEYHKLVSEVRGVLINRYPNCHGMVLQLTVHLIHIKSLVQILL